MIGVFSPHWVACFDADTGNVVWQDELSVMALPTLGKGRRTIEQVPDMAMARKLQKLWEMSNALLYLHNNGYPFAKGFENRIEQALEEKPELKSKLADIWTRSIARLMEWRRFVVSEFPNDKRLLTALDTTIVGFHKDAESLGVALPAELAGKNLPNKPWGWCEFGSGVNATIERAGFVQDRRPVARRRIGEDRNDVHPEDLKHVLIDKGDLLNDLHGSDRPL